MNNNYQVKETIVSFRGERQTIRDVLMETSTMSIIFISYVGLWICENLLGYSLYFPLSLKYFTVCVLF